MNWDDPVERAALIERVGPQEYNRQILQHHEDSAVANVNGHRIRPVGTRWGRLFQVDGTNKAFAHLSEAIAFAAKQEETLDDLIDELRAWCEKNKIPHESADELYCRSLCYLNGDSDGFEETYTKEQSEYLRVYCERWESTEDREVKEMRTR